MKLHHATFLLSATFARVYGSIVPPSGGEDGPQCTGLTIDFTRLRDVTDSDINTVTGSFGDGRSYGTQSIVPVIDHNTEECVKKRHRLHETKNGVTIFGADVVVTVDNCLPPDQSAFEEGHEQNALLGVPVSAISGMVGKTFSLIEEVSGSYIAQYDEDAAVEALASHFGTPVDNVGTPELKIFPSYEEGDKLAYRSEVWVTERDDDGVDIQLYDVFISAHTLEMISICSKVNRQRQSRLRRLRGLQASTFEASTAAKEMCGSCASQDTVTWTTKEVECPINSLYLNDENRTTTCMVGNLDGGTGKQVLGPGIVNSLSYFGTYDCNSRESGCNANALPTDCSDSLSDVHYGVTETMKFMQEYLGVMGGLNVDAANPIKTASFVHFAFAYCNAFFTTQTNSLYFGDCDCGFWTPLTSVDVAAHELAHGITNYASGLVYAYQPGGLNEGFSDIVGATMEYYINDSKDTPDFTLGENLIGDGLEGYILRYMESPAQDGKSIDNVCSFNNNLNVHYTSGVPNKAFTASVRACQRSGCDDERGCVLLMGATYMYGNIQGLTQLSGYLDAAVTTCNLASEYHDLSLIRTQCTSGQTMKFVREGWAAVGITLFDDCSAATTSGCVIPSIPAGAGGNVILDSILDCLGSFIGTMNAVVSLLFSPFANGN